MGNNCPKLQVTSFRKEQFNWVFKFIYGGFEAKLCRLKKNILLSHLSDSTTELKKVEMFQNKSFLIADTFWSPNYSDLN